METLIVREPINPEALSVLANEWHGTLVKGVADVVTGRVALGGEWHMDANVRLIEEGSDQRDLWGFNLYPTEKGSKAIEYTSLINIRPAQGNRSMELMDEEKREAVRRVVAPLVPFLDL